jgi:hypothetical protein
MGRGTDHSRAPHANIKNKWRYTTSSGRAQGDRLLQFINYELAYIRRYEIFVGLDERRNETNCSLAIWMLLTAYRNVQINSTRDRRTRVAKCTEEVDGGIFEHSLWRGVGGG